MEMSIYYRDPQIGTRRVDFFVEGIISVELKAITKLEDMNYQELFQITAVLTFI